MWNINYNFLFNLRISHTYFVENKARGIRVSPTAQTLRVMKNNKMLFREIPHGATVLYRADDDEVTPFTPAGNDLRLVFVVEVSEPARFLNITDMDVSPTDTYSAGRILFYENQAGAVSTDPDNPEQITHQLLDGIRHPLFTWQFGISGSPAQVLLRVRNADGDLVSTGKDTAGNPLPDTITLDLDDDGQYRHSLDLRDKPSGRYRVTIRNTADDTTLLEREFYVSEDLASKQVLGITEISYDLADGNLYGDAEEYELQFNRKETVWTYYVVNKSDNVIFGTDDLSIDDPGSGTYPARTFARDGNEPHDDIKVNGLDTVVFRSDDVIPFFEMPKLSIQLKKNPGNQTLIQSLPNPSHSGVVKKNGSTPESEIYVFI